MSDDARQYLRAAQEAELRGDVPHAVELLMKAAAVYRTRGQTARALQMLRHANRLDTTRADLAEEVRRLEWLPEEPMLRAVEAEEPGRTEEDRALASLDELAEPTRERRLIERGPTLADPQLNAWCSFCCRPRGEVGELVAGPAGAFVCQTCLRDSAKLLGVELGSGGATAPSARPVLRAVASPGPAADDEPLEPLAQDAAVRALDAALKLGLRCILVLGPEGSGKTTWLRALERRGVGRYVAHPREWVDAPRDERLLLDAVERARPEELAELRTRIEARDEVILAVRGAPGEPPLVLSGGEAELPLVSTRALVEATQGLLAAELAEHVEAVATLAALEADALEEIARRILLRRRDELELSDAGVQAIAQEAARSGRGGHEVRALLRRIPRGSWSVRTPPAAPAPDPGPTAGPGGAGAGGGKRRRASPRKKSE